MNASKLVVAAATAISVIGGIGFAYAQTTSPAASSAGTGLQQPTPPPMPITDSTMPANRTSSGTMTQPSAGGVNAPATDTTLGGTTSTRNTTPNAGSTVRSDGSVMRTGPAERAERADRN